MAGETTLTIVGNLTADPEIRTIGTGATVANFTVASTPRVWNRQTNQYEDVRPCSCAAAHGATSPPTSPNR